MSGIVMGFQINAMKAVQIDRLCRQAGLVFKPVKESEFGQPLGVVAGIQGFPRQDIKAYPKLPEEVLVFSGIDSPTLDAFLAAYRAAQIPKVELKAVLTPYNIFMNIGTLYEELAKERKAMQQ